MASYNPWYSASYESIFEMCNWDDFSSDIEKKIVCVFAWMPRAIMNISHSGKGENHKTKAMEYSPGRVKKELEEVGPVAAYFKRKTLKDVDLGAPMVRCNTIKLCAQLFNVFGSVAGSKFLHFSYPYFFIMWDSGLRKKNGLRDTPNDYYGYLIKAQKSLKHEKTFRLAQREYPSNPVRGLDIHWMKTKRQPARFT